MRILPVMARPIYFGQSEPPDEKESDGWIDEHLWRRAKDYLDETIRDNETSWVIYRRLAEPQGETNEIEVARIQFDAEDSHYEFRQIGYDDIDRERLFQCNVSIGADDWRDQRIGEKVNGLILSGEMISLQTGYYVNHEWEDGYRLYKLRAEEWLEKLLAIHNGDGGYNNYRIAEEPAIDHDEGEWYLA